MFANAYFAANQGDIDMGGQVFAQAKADWLTVIYTTIASWVRLQLINATIGLRVDENDEVSGIDYALLDRSGYEM